MTDVAGAVLARLTAALPNDVKVFDGTAPGIPPARYVVLFCDSGRRENHSADGLSRDVTFNLQVTSVATAADSIRSAAPLCRWLVEQVRDALTDWQPVADGLVVGPLQHSDSRHPIPDESLGDRHIVFAVDRFKTQADRVA